ncbi:DUF2142 domain-containing protein [Leifsonia sp. ZF2019]|uniref:DUF2142 domain-containing protein n=1 Tax=Leifsonia sp. ZF2019 TaxID=2781978 RepID=UPI001CBBA326|nr:DUF2142 domain-containing protein [Leifsonia sp. ZF2019]UAJ80566.1 DUF2142 domain-containing protein [Leifsonia sp. ZF2019]
MPRVLRPVRVFWIAFALFAALAGCWALATPVLSVPDENAHVVKAVAQVHGELIGHRVPDQRQLVMDLPQGYAYTQQVLCFAFHPAQSGDCGAELGDAGGSVEVATWVSAYNPLYYYVVGWPSLFIDGNAGVYAMRIVSGLVGALFFAWAAQAAIATVRARWMPAALLFGALPMVVYLTGAVNPNGFEALSAFALAMALLRLLEHHDPGYPVPLLSRRSLWIVVTVSSIALANARALGPLWLVVVVGLCLFAVGWTAVKNLFVARSSWLWLALIAAGGLFSLLWTLGGGSLSGQAEKSDAPLVGAGFLPAAAYMVRMIPTFAVQTLGYFGWFDTPLPGYALWPAVAAVTLLVVLAFVTARRREVLTLAVTGAVVVLLPIVVQAYSARQTGIIWQGRYGLFLYLTAFAIAAWALSRRGGERVDFLAPRITWTMSALLWVFVNLSFVLVLRRYVTGLDVPIGGLFKDPQWQPPLGWFVLAALYALVSAALMAYLARLSQRAAPTATLVERPEPEHAGLVAGPTR